MNVISRAALLAAATKPRRTKLVELPELGGQRIIVRAMSAGERGRYEASFIDKKGSTIAGRAAKARELLAVECCVDEAGNRLFTPDDVATLSQVDASILDRIAEAARELSGISDADQADLVGNSDPTPSGNSRCDSPSGSVPLTSTDSSTP